MMRLLTLGITIFVLFERANAGIKFEEENCQQITPEQHFRPKVEHKILDKEFLDKFNEIIVIGDQHGCYDEQQLLLQRYNLNNDTVLKIFTGDFSRKGPKNLEVIRFIKNCSSCLSVRGNNDEKTLLRIYAKEHDPNYTYAFIDEWMANLTQEEIDWMKDLPYTLHLPSMNARVVHGGFLPGGVPLEDNRPYTMMNIRTIIPDPDCPGGWRPSRIDFIGEYPWASEWRGPEHVFFGHDHKRQLQLYPFATGVDTACVRGHYMTGLFIKGPREGTFATQPALKQYYIGKV